MIKFKGLILLNNFNLHHNLRFKAYIKIKNEIINDYLVLIWNKKKIKFKILTKEQDQCIFKKKRFNNKETLIKIQFIFIWIKNII